MTTKYFDCDRCGVPVEFVKYQYEYFKGHKFKKELLKCPKCGELFNGDETLA